MRFLDFHKVKDAERQRAKELFGIKDAPTELATKVRRSSCPLGALVSPLTLLVLLDPGHKVQGPRDASLRGGGRHVQARPDKTHRRGEEEAAGDDQEGQQSGGDYPVREDAE